MGTPLGIAVATTGVAAIAGTAFALTSTGGSGTNVLGEKIVGSGTSASTTSNSGPSTLKAGPKPSPGPTSKPGPSSPPGGAPSFTIAGDVEGLYPGHTVNLVLTVSTSFARNMTVNVLSATLNSVAKATNAPTGTCSPNITVGAWTNGAPFLLPARTSNQSAPGYIPVTLASNAPPACEGATFKLTYSGTASPA